MIKYLKEYPRHEWAERIGQYDKDLKCVVLDDGKIYEIHSSFSGMSGWQNKIWLPAWTPGELRQIADEMEGGGFFASKLVCRIDPKPEYSDPWRLTAEQKDLDEQMNGDDDRPY